MDETGHMTFADIDPQTVNSGQYTLAHGTAPGVAMLIVYPWDQAPQKEGNLVISYGGNRLVFRDCLLDSATLKTTGTGQVIECFILDRRWKWANPIVSGFYNLYDDAGLLDTTTEKTPQELATLCLTAMGETGFDVTALPNDGRPSVAWDYSSAAQSLESLCESYGCRVVLGLDDKVRICVAGEGANLPILDGVIMSGGEVLNPPETPESIIVIGDPDQFQADFRLEAVGLDKDGTIQLVDSLTYKPTDGWTTAEIELGAEAVINENDVPGRILAQRTVFKWYRLRESAMGDNLPDALKQLGIPFTEPYQIEWLPHQLETKTGIDGPEQRSPTVYGYFAEGDDLSIGNNLSAASAIVPLDQESTADTHYKMTYRGEPRLDVANRDIESGGFGIDLKNKIVMFAEPVYSKVIQANDKAEFYQATLYLRIAFNARKKDNREYVYTESIKSMGGTCKPLYVRMPGTARKLAPKYGATTFATAGYIIDNSADVVREAQLYGNGAAKEFQTVTAATYTYEAIVPIHPDGAISQISWSVGSSDTAKTVAQRNNDVQSYLPSYQERRQRQKTEELRKAFASIQKFASGLGATS